MHGLLFKSYFICSVDPKLHARQPEKTPAYNNVRDHFQIEQKGSVKIYGMNVASQLSCEIIIITVLLRSCVVVGTVSTALFWVVEGTSMLLHYKRTDVNCLNASISRVT